MAARKGARARRICVVTGSRADFGLLEPVMQEIRSTPGLSLQVVVAGMHLDYRHGMTIREVEKRFPVQGRVRMANPDDSGRGMAEALGQGLRTMARALEDLEPDIVLVLGDRDEALCGALAASHMAIPIAHIHGGDVSCAGVDDSNRHAITKLAHLHFAATRASMRRILRLGEDPSRVWNSGSPGIDLIARVQYVSRLEVFRRLRIPSNQEVLVVLQHAVSYSPQTSRQEMTEVLEAVRATGLPAVVIYPNSDPGSRGIVDAIRRLALPPQFRMFKNLEREFFLSLMANAQAMVGNSSAGIIESSHFGLPSVQVGQRQRGRERGANVIDVPAERRAIRAALRRACEDRAFRRAAARARCPYGDGKSAARIVRTLARVALGPALVQKRLHYDA